MSAADIPIVPASILKRKKDSEAYYDAYHAPNPKEPAPFDVVAKKRSRKKQALAKFVAEPEITPKFASEGFRAEKPSVQALALVSNKLSTSNAFSPAKQENASDIASVSKNQALSNVSQNAIGTATQSQKSQKSQKSQNNWYPDYDKPIYDAKYTEVVDDGVIITPPPFRKAPSKDARSLGLAQKSKHPERPS